MSRCDETGRAKSTLKRMVLAKRRLQGRQFIAGESLNRHHFLTVRLRGEHEAGANGLAIHKDGAGSADTMLARKMGTGLAEVIPNAVRESRTGLDICADRRSIQIEFDFHSFFPNTLRS
jgi:hypothetical protein